MTNVYRKSGYKPEPLPELHAGDQLEQKEFHYRYDAMPENYKAELIGGIVFEPSPLGDPHGMVHACLATLFGIYAGNTPGLSVLCNATVILGPKDEVQPDLTMRIDPQKGGQSRNIQLNSRRYGMPITYVKGAPEMVAEIAHSSRAIDMHLKKQRYALAGVLEYLVVNLHLQRIHWLDLQNNKELIVDNDGIFRSGIFPGLWIHERGLLTPDYNLTMEWLNRGLQSGPHRLYVSRQHKPL